VFGGGIAEILASAGAFVYVNDLHEDRAAEVVAAIRTKGNNASAAIFDVRCRFGGFASQMGKPEEVGLAAAWLSSEDGGFITGQVIHLNGGTTFGR
jgi:NAD(P)-dependent dehydrogenase (short-subunit alcohol dehydrogenase family)